jgi:2-methylcitrate dehydratase PrpD
MSEHQVCRDSIPTWSGHDYGRRHGRLPDMGGSVREMRMVHRDVLGARQKDVFMRDVVPELTKRVANFSSSDSCELDESAVELTVRTLIDTVGVAIAARHESALRILRESLGEHLPAGRSTIWVNGETTDAGTAALLNGTASHALDFDDVSDLIYGHPSAVLWPALLAVAEEKGCSGRSLIEAYVVGFGVDVALARALDIRAHYSAGWHATATIGVMGTTCGVSRLMGLDEEQTRHAIGIAASLAGGSRQNFGTMTKPLHVGVAARNAIFAATLAFNGFTADPSQLESPLGYVAMFVPNPNLDEALLALTCSSALLNIGTNVKYYPCCYNTQRSIDATRECVAGGGIKTSAIRRVHVTMEPGGLDPLIHHRPKTGLQGKFSLEYVVAATLLDEAVTLASFTDEAVQRAEVQQLMSKISFETKAVPPVGLLEWHEAYSVVTIETEDGEFTKRVDVPRGHRNVPLTRAELDAKFEDCLTFSGTGWDACALLSELRHIGNVEVVLGFNALNLGPPSE